MEEEPDGRFKAGSACVLEFSWASSSLVEELHRFLAKPRIADGCGFAARVVKPIELNGVSVECDFRGPYDVECRRPKICLAATFSVVSAVRGVSYETAEVAVVWFETKKAMFVLVWLPGEELCAEAELCGLRKRTPGANEVVPFSRVFLSRFIEPHDSDESPSAVLCKLFVSSERQFLLLNRLNHVRIRADTLPMLASGEQPESQPADGAVGGDENFLVYRLLKGQALRRVFPLHDEGELAALKKRWFEATKMNFELVAGEVKDYFGYRIAMYFAFLAFYTKALAAPAAAAVLFWLVNLTGPATHLMFSAFNLMWVTVFLCMWKRKSATLAFQWGGVSAGGVEAEQPRIEFKGYLKTNPETREPELTFSRSQRLAVMLTRSYPAVLGCLALAVLAMAVYFPLQLAVEAACRAAVMKERSVVPLIRLVPSMCYTFCVVQANKHYAAFAVKLNDLENHRLPSDYGKHLVVKLLLFHFVNSFGLLFYIAFWLQDFERLNRYLMCLLITSQLSQQVMEVGVPFVSAQRAKISEKYGDLLSGEGGGDLTALEKKLVVESRMNPYKDTFDDYLELWLQFGHAFLFSPVFPFAAVFALLNNVVEMRSDAFKLCTAHQRPFALSWANTGIWQDAFAALALLAVMTNGALMALSPGMRSLFRSWSDANYILLFVAFEHVLVLSQVALMRVIPEVPESVQLAMDRSEAVRREAIRLEDCVVLRREWLQQLKYRAASKDVQQLPRSTTFDDSFVRA